MYVRACVGACVHVGPTRVCVCVCGRVRACVRVCMYVCMSAHLNNISFTLSMYRKFSFRKKTVCWLAVELKNKNCILKTGFEPGPLVFRANAPYQLSYPGQIRAHDRINLL